MSTPLDEAIARYRTNVASAMDTVFERERRHIAGSPTQAVLCNDMHVDHEWLII